MLLAHKIELRPTLEQRDYLDRACGHRRHCYNQLLEYFSQREATLHQLSDYLTKTFDRIVIEDLNVKGMMKNRKLSRAIADVEAAIFKF